jgi:hypothetical protein
MPENVPMVHEFAPNYAVVQVIGDIKGKRAIHIARQRAGRQKDFTGDNVRARVDFVSTIGLDDNVVRAYIETRRKKMSGTNGCTRSASKPTGRMTCALVVGSGAAATSNRSRLGAIRPTVAAWGVTRRVMERTIARLARFRSLRVRFEHRGDIHEASPSLAEALICCNALQRA